METEYYISYPRPDQCVVDVVSVFAENKEEALKKFNDGIGRSVISVASLQRNVIIRSRWPWQER